MDNFTSLFSCLVTNVWNMLTTIIYPGTTLSIAAILLGAFLAVFGLRLAAKLIGISYNVGGMATGAARSGHNLKMHNQRVNKNG